MPDTNIPTSEALDTLRRPPPPDVPLSSPRVSEGLPYPMGASWNGLGVNFALFSANATRVELCLFDDSGEREIGRVDLPEFTDEIWHGFLPDARPGTIYGFRVHGPYSPEEGHRFNHHKLLLDPYAKAVVGHLVWNPALFGYVMEGGDDTTFDERDSAPFMPKARVIDPAFTWGRDQPPLIPWDQTIFYETHVKGYTMHHPAVSESMRGTYAGLGSPEVVDYISKLGVTSVELLPVHMFVDDSQLLEKGLKNYWGYNTISFFAPARRYAHNPDFAFSEFKEMVARLHAAKLEVILDVVYNHTAEGNERGPTISFKGIDNASYYRLMPQRPRYYINDTGTGNTLNLSHPRVLQMVTDSLRYWVTEMHVDGFRFDLATILGREPTGFDEGGGFLDSCRQDPVLSSVKLIAEPWDLGPGGYQVGGFPPGWAEWNDRYRDTVRSFWKGDLGQAGEMAARLSASGDKFNRRGRKPWSSVNFVTAHDGFTLRDLVSFNHKHNDANGEQNRDGHSHNHSWNCGVEGDTEQPEVLALRARQQRNMLATVLLSQGTPLLTAGDEFSRTQRGNNNAYCQDNDISWVDWTPTADGEAMRAWTKRLLKLREEYPVLRRARFLSGALDPATGVRDVTWINATGREMTPVDWHDGNTRCFGMLLDGRAQASNVRRTTEDATLLWINNAYHDVVRFMLPRLAGGRAWTRVFDTADPGLPSDTFRAGRAYELVGRSAVLLELRQPRV